MLLRQVTQQMTSLFGKMKRGIPLKTKNMKKLLLSVALFAASSSAFAQVGINTTTPEGVLDVVSENSGIILPRVANVSAVTSPVNGMMVYDLSNNCIRAYEGGSWTDCLSGAETTAVFATGPCKGQPVEFTFNGVTYKPVASSGKCWLDRNLGATQVATSSADAASYGDLYQWGRLADGHQIRTSETTTTLSATDTPENGNFIIESSDWRSPQNDNLWQGVNGINNPCPSGYRIPTQAEWQAEDNAFSPNNAAGAFASPLKLPVAGYRGFSFGLLRNVGSFGVYWSSSVSGTFARYLFFNSSNAIMSTNVRAYGFSVRCLKD
jgi:uncharacterized protein (TIGR02145 family)